MESIQALFTQFTEALDENDKVKAINVFQNALSNTDLSIPMLYEQLLAPSLNHIASNAKDQEIPIWKEHLASSTVRTALELSYLRVLKDQQPKTDQRALVFCLEEEYHELGARMTADYLTLLGFETFFIGANTPRKEIFEAIGFFNPNVVCISVTNYFHLSRLHDLIEQLPEHRSFKLIVGGYAVHHSSNVEALVKADFYANAYDDLKKIKEAIL
jgi:MerR family transcriptional regulator, light-induced transcriptional regulator